MADPSRRKAYRLGLSAESRAALYLFVKGYKILARRYKAPGGEIDIVALKNGALVFAEVKARARAADSFEAVGTRAQRRIERAARHFLALHPAYAAHDLRFDVLAVSGFRITHLDNAWRPAA